MPNGDGTGPRGAGPRTGRGLGNCSVRGGRRSTGKRIGRGLGRGLGRRNK